jgi:hypothetical protein
LSAFLWLLSPSVNRPPVSLPPLFLIWAPLTAALIIAYLGLARRGNESFSQLIRNIRQPDSIRILLFVFGLGILTIFGYLAGNSANSVEQILLVIHLPILSVIAVGFFLVDARSDDRDRHAALLKGAEIALTGGLILIAVLIFVAITIGLFSTIGVTVPEPLQRWLFFGLPGLIPIISISLLYNPNLPPREQRFDQGLSKLIFSVGRLFLPLVLLVGVFYLASIPGNFFKPFRQREVLIIFNVMLFAVIALMALATPLTLTEIPQRWRGPLRRAIIVLSTMTIVVSLYALAATLYRTFMGGLTLNRLTVIGWNCVNSAILGYYLIRQRHSGLVRWLPLTQEVLRFAMFGYTIWTGMVIFIVTFFPI